ncbi:MAG: ankyrin repeat domain-containing protein [Akkermansiaceae bacterium]|nr:ankyrin repeat domain-containing protein [Akkermansiaceae bacterium]
MVGSFSKGDTDAPRETLAAGADANAADEFGWTSLMRAAMQGQADCVKLLLVAGADVNAVDE